LDDHGRLISFAISAGAGVPSASLRYSEFSAAVTVARPGDAVPAPDAVYSLLGLH
jgi:hypothetical protein